MCKVWSNLQAFVADMKKRETLWDLLKRLDEEAGQCNYYLHQANRYFESTANATQKLLDRHEKELHRLIRKIKKPLRSFMDDVKKDQKKNTKNT